MTKTEQEAREIILDQLNKDTSMVCSDYANNIKAYRIYKALKDKGVLRDENTKES